MIGEDDLEGDEGAPGMPPAAAVPVAASAGT